MGFKWLIALAAIVAIILGVLVGNGIDTMDADVQEASESNSEPAAERMPIPPAAE